MILSRDRLVRVALCAALPLAALAALVPGAVFRGETFWVSDLGGFHRPIRSLMLRLTHDSGGLPAWNPYLALGQPYAANPHHALFHPTTALFFLLPFETAFRMQVLLPVLAAFGAMVYFLRTQGRSLAGSLFGGTCWAFGGSFLSGTILLPIALTLAPMPATLAFAMRLARTAPGQGTRTGIRATWRELAGCALSFGLQGLAGEPGSLLITLGLLPLAALDGFLHRGKTDRPRTEVPVGERGGLRPAEQSVRGANTNAAPIALPSGPGALEREAASTGGDPTGLAGGPRDGRMRDPGSSSSSRGHDDRSARWREAARLAALLALAVALGVGVAGAALLPAAALGAKSSRAAAGGIPRAEAEIWSMPPARAAELVFPRSLGYLDRQWDQEGWYWGAGLYPMRGRPFLFSIYVGALPLVLALVGFSRERRRFAPWIAAGVLGALLALGPAALLWTAARWAVPLFASVRYPERWILAATFVLAALAARGFDALLEPPNAPRRLARGALGVLAGLFAAGAAACWFAGAGGGARYADLGLPADVAGAVGGALAYDLLFASGIALAAAVLASLAGASPAVASQRPTRLPPWVRGRTWAAAGLIAITAVDLVHTFRPYALTERPDILGAPPPLFQRLLAERPTGPIFHYAAYDRTAPRQEDLAAPPVPALWGLATTLEQDFDVSELAWSRGATKRFFEASVSDPDLVAPLLARRGVGAIVRVRRPAQRGARPMGRTREDGSAQPQAPPPVSAPIDDASRRHEVEGDILRPAGSLPFLVCLDRVESASGEEGWLTAVRSLKGEASHTAIIDSAEAGAAEVPSRPGSCETALAVRTPVRLEARVVARGPAPSLLAVNQTWDPGWSASIDGAPARLLRTDLCLSAVVVPPGEHRVALGYHDPWLGRGIAVSLVSLALSAGLVVLSSRRANRTPSLGQENRK